MNDEKRLREIRERCEEVRNYGKDRNARDTEPAKVIVGARTHSILLLLADYDVPWLLERLGRAVSAEAALEKIEVMIRKALLEYQPASSFPDVCGVCEGMSEMIKDWREGKGDD